MGRQRPATSLGTTGGIQWDSIIVILYFSSGKGILSDVATSAGFEPATCPLGGGCSIQLNILQILNYFKVWYKKLDRYKHISFCKIYYFDVSQNSAY